MMSGDGSVNFNSEVTMSCPATTVYAVISIPLAPKLTTNEFLLRICFAIAFAIFEKSLAQYFCRSFFANRENPELMRQF